MYKFKIGDTVIWDYPGKDKIKSFVLDIQTNKPMAHEAKITFYTLAPLVRKTDNSYIGVRSCLLSANMVLTEKINKYIGKVYYDSTTPCY